MLSRRASSLCPPRSQTEQPEFFNRLLDLQDAFTFGKVETGGDRVLHTEPGSRFEIADGTHFLQSHRLAVLCDLPGRAGGRGESERIGRSGEGGGESDGALALFDLRQLTSGLVARQFAALHPEGLIGVVLVDGGDDFPAMSKSVLRSIGIEPRPVAEHDGRLTGFDQLGHPPLRAVFVDVFITRWDLIAVPIAEPVARAGGNIDRELWIGSIEAFDMFENRPGALPAFDDVFEIEGNLQ